MDMVQNVRPPDGQNRQVALRQLAVFCMYRLCLEELAEHGVHCCSRDGFKLVVGQQKSKAVAKNLVAGLLKTCKLVQKNKGAVVRG